MSEKTFWQTIETSGEQVLTTLKQLIEAGNVRRIRVRHKDRVIAEFPLTVGVIGTLIAPVAAAIGALTAVLAECSIDVERTQQEPSAPSPDSTSPMAD
jgi:hypothetical protein